MLVSKRLNWLVLLSSCLWSFSVCAARAQIIPDNILGSESSTVNTEDNLTNLIQGGAIRNNNLFHSFSEFNVEDGNAAYFANPNGVANIITRVTGNNISQIFGTLGVDGAANLFLLNPNGIVFGENAVLDINGSFLATTADSYIFDDSLAYGASNPDEPPLLTINIPIGLQFGSKSVDIEVKGTGNNLSLNPFDGSVVRDLRNPGLQISTDRTLALVGGQLNLEGGNLTSEAGRIELGSIAEAGLVSILPTDNGFTIGYENIDRFGDINLTKAASVDVSGSGSGSLQVRGRNLSISDGSAILANTLGADNGKEINLITSDSIKVSGVNFTNGFPFVSSILNEVEVTATGDGGNAIINTKNLLVADSGRISSSNFGLRNSNSGNQTITTDTLKIASNAQVGSATYGEGNGGNVSIAAREIEVVGTVDNNFFTGLFTNVVATPANEFFLGTKGTGDGGNLSIQTEQLQVSDTGLISSSVLGEGDGGDIDITTDTLKIMNGGQISSGTFDAGNSGNLSLTAKDIEIVGVFDDSLLTGLFSNVLSSAGNHLIRETIATGNGGNLNVQTEQLQVKDFGLISSTVLGEGDGGNLNITADRLQILRGGQIGSGTSARGKAGNLMVIANEMEIKGYGTIFLPSIDNEDIVFSRLFSSVGRGGVGNGGNLSVETANLQLSNGGTIEASTSGMGDAGDITIMANDVEIKDSIVNRLGINSGITSSVELTGKGEGGNIKLNLNELRLLDGGVISVDAEGQGNAGNIAIDAGKISIDGVSSGEEIENISQQQSPAIISAFSQGKFDAGSIAINSNNLQISDRGKISVSNLGSGDSGNLNIYASELRLDRSAAIEALVNTGERGNINVNTDNIFSSEQSIITANAANTATGGNIVINNTENIVLSEDSRIIANAIAGNGGNIDITTQGYFVSADSFVSASSEFGLDGNIEVETINGDLRAELDRLPENLVDATQKITQTCGVGENRFAIAGRGGLPENPSQNLRGKTVWQDLRLPVRSETASSLSNANLSLFVPVEANRWQINQQGKIQLLAFDGRSNRQRNYHNCGRATR